MAFKKVMKKVARKARGYAIKRYFNKGYKPKIGTIAKDVMTLKKLINTEKKTSVIAGNGQAVGQLNGNASGYYITDVTPVPTAGVGESQRIGTSIKLMSSHMQFQMISQSASINRTKFKVIFLQNKGEPITNLNTWADSILKPNNFVTGTATVRDYNSSWEPNTFGNFRILRTKYISIAPDSISNEVNIKTFNIGMKWNKGKGMHIRYNSGGNTPSHQQIFMLVLADTGNCSQTTATTGTFGIAQTAINTGYTFNFYARHYYIDN